MYKKAWSRAKLLFCLTNKLIFGRSRCLRRRRYWSSIGSLSNSVFERRTSTGSEVFFILKHLDAPKFVFLSVLTIIETSFPKKWAKPLSKNEKKTLPVDVRRSKTPLLMDRLLGKHIRLLVTIKTVETVYLKVRSKCSRYDKITKYNSTKK